MTRETLCVRAEFLSHAQLFDTTWTVAYQAPLSVWFSRQEYWSGLPFSLPDQTHISCIAGRFFTTEHPWKHCKANQNHSFIGKHLPGDWRSKSICVLWTSSYSVKTKERKYKYKPINFYPKPELNFCRKLRLLGTHI